MRIDFWEFSGAFVLKIFLRTTGRGLLAFALRLSRLFFFFFFLAGNAVRSRFTDLSYSAQDASSFFITNWLQQLLLGIIVPGHPGLRTEDMQMERGGCPHEQD
jgi:hypothetical protein